MSSSWECAKSGPHLLQLDADVCLLSKPLLFLLQESSLSADFTSSDQSRLYYCLDMVLNLLHKVLLGILRNILR